MIENFYFIVLFISGILTYFSAKIYKVIFNYKNKKISVPTGFGFTLPILLISILTIFKFDYLNINIYKSIFIILIGGLLYLIDDLKGLSPAIRLFISSISGIILLNQNNLYEYNSFNIALLYIFSVLILCLLTNVLNFYDGADLNLTTTIFLFGCCLLKYKFLLFYSSVLIGYTIGFGLLNKKSNSIYLGDSGSYVFASIIFLIFTSSFFESNFIPLASIYPLIFPIIDVLFVLVIRIKKKHNLLSRNYLHIYQRININYKSFLYLLPQFIHLILALYIDFILNSFGVVNKLQITLFVSTIYSPLFYFFTRKFFLEKSYFFGDGSRDE